MDIFLLRRERVETDPLFVTAKTAHSSTTPCKYFRKTCSQTGKFVITLPIRQHILLPVGDDRGTEHETCLCSIQHGRGQCCLLYCTCRARDVTAGTCFRLTEGRGYRSFSRPSCSRQAHLVPDHFGGRWCDDLLYHGAADERLLARRLEPVPRMSATAWRGRLHTLPSPRIPREPTETRVSSAPHFNHPQPEQRPASVPHTHDATQAINWRYRKQRHVISHRVFSGQKLTTRPKDRETS